METIYTEDTFDTSTAKVGDLVEEQVVDNFMDCLPPACYRQDCAQLGEPSNYKQDEKTGKWRPTFLTFRKVRDGVWAYCGKCFCGENTEHGKDALYVSL